MSIDGRQRGSTQIPRDRVFVVTLRMDPASTKRLDELRQRFFPPERNFLSAHLTLFHALSHEQCVQLRDYLIDSHWPSMPIEFVAPISLGHGVAIRVSSTELLSRHASAVEILKPDRLTRQDRQPLRPHVTVQNKVTAIAANATLAQIQGSFLAWRGTAVGVDFWQYLDGPWAPAGNVPFTH